MTRDEVVVLCGYLAEVCPQQKFGEYTPSAWADVLADWPEEGPLTFAEAREAIVAIKRRQSYIDPADILAECESARRAELGRKRRAVIDAQLPPAISPAIAVQAAPPGKREHLKDPRPLRESIGAILSRHGRPELTP